MPDIVPLHFPELRVLAWNRDPARPMNAADVFGLYERNWRFIDLDALTTEERQLIEDLKDRYGRGHLLVR